MFAYPTPDTCCVSTRCVKNEPTLVRCVVELFNGLIPISPNVNVNINVNVNREFM